MTTKVPYSMLEPADIAFAASGIHALLTAPRFASMVAVLSGYHADQKYGGGTFKWSPTTPKASHNGGTVISPTVPWDGTQPGLAAFLAGAGETLPAGSGCWIRQSNSTRLVDFGAVISDTVDSSAAWAAANTYAAVNHLELELPDGLVRVNTPWSIEGAVDTFATIKLRGTFCSTGARLNANPGECGSVILTDGNAAIDVWFNLFSNENIDVRGIGFVDTSFYPAGQPVATTAPIIVRKGNLDGSSPRYITGNVFEDVAAVSYAAMVHFVGLVPESVPSAVLLNYFGPTTFRRAYPYRCDDAVLLTDCSFNHLWVSDSVFHELTGQGIFLEQTAGGTGGNVSATFNNMVFEGTAGFVNTSGARTGAGAERNKFVFNSCNREFCGLFGPTGPDGEHSGNPLGFIGQSDVSIGGTWHNGLAFGELTVPTADVGSVISSSVPASFVGVGPGGGDIATPETINKIDETFTLPAGGSLNKVLAHGASGVGFASDVQVFFDDGFVGQQKISAYGNTSGVKYRDVTGTVGSGITPTYSGGVAGQMLEISLANSTGFAVAVRIVAISRAGISQFLA